MIDEKFRGWPFREFLLQNGDKIICTYSWDGSEPKESIHDALHNIFRLDKDGNVVWQVKRDEQTKLYPKDWQKRSERSNKIFEGKHQGPFARLSTNFIKRGTYNEFEETPAKYRSDTWKPDYVLLAWVYGRGVYELDIETGIAKNVTQPGGRDW
ncbi:MAG: hypothetical protein HOP21_06825 [Methylotenera sp.]|nr:hypothetical protein [Methylotenera sp.]